MPARTAVDMPTYPGFRPTRSERLLNEIAHPVWIVRQVSRLRPRYANGVAVACAVGVKMEMLVWRRKKTGGDILASQVCVSDEGGCHLEAAAQPTGRTVKGLTLPQSDEEVGVARWSEYGWQRTSPD